MTADGDGSDECRDAPIALQIEGKRETEVGHQDVNRTRDSDAGSPPGKCAGKCEQPGLDKDLRCNARRLGSKRGADGDFAAATCGMLAKQRGNIDADQQHQQA